MSGAILAIDTSTEACSAALLLADDTEPRVRSAETPRAHAELILPMVESLLAECNLALKELAAIAFARGPGSFTGVRLAASVTQGLAYGAGLPVVPVSTLAAVALAAFECDRTATHVLVCNDARMGEVYWAIFDRELTLWSAGEQVSPPGDVRPPGDGQPSGDMWSSSRSTRWALAGHGLAAYPEIIERWREALALQDDARITHIDATRLPSAREVALLGRRGLEAGEAISPMQAAPIYVRDRVTEPKAEHKI